MLGNPCATVSGYFFQHVNQVNPYKPSVPTNQNDNTNTEIIQREAHDSYDLNGAENPKVTVLATVQ